MLDLNDDTLIQVLSWTDNATLRSLVSVNKELSEFVRTHRMEICRLKLARLGKDVRDFTDEDSCYIYKYRNHFETPYVLLFYGITNNDTRLINLSIDLKANLSTNGTYALLIASMNGNNDLVNRLIQKGVPSDDDAILNVIQNLYPGNPESNEFYRRPHTQTLVPSMVSERFGISALTLKLLKPGLTVDFIRNVPQSAFSLKTPFFNLQDVIDFDNIKVKLLINDKTPLMLALVSMYSGDENIMRHIIDRTPESAFLIQDRDGVTALHMAIVNEEDWGEPLKSSVQMAVVNKAPVSCFLQKYENEENDEESDDDEDEEEMLAGFGGIPLHIAIVSVKEDNLTVPVCKEVIRKTPLQGFHIKDKEGYTPLELANKLQLSTQLRQLIAQKTNNNESGGSSTKKRRRRR